MAIEFKCTACGKELFAQEQYAGMQTTCPGCRSKMQIPSPPAGAFEAVSASEIAALADSPGGQAQPDEFSLIDMEKIPPTELPMQPIPSAPIDPPDRGAEQPAGVSDPTKRCPMCAETIKAAAKKCRYCGEILDDDLKREEALNKRREAIAAAAALARRSDGIFRGASILATMLTAGWLTLQTLSCVSLQLNASLEPGLARAPWTLYLFNALLIGGMFTLVRQMKHGPYHVFLAAALAIVICFPLDMALGFPLQGLEKVAEEGKKNEFHKNWSATDFYYLAGFGYSFMGLLISLPVWFTALKLGFQSRAAAKPK